MNSFLKHKSDWSQNERIFAKMLDIIGIKYTFEPETIEILPSQYGTIGRYKPMFYTPDFKFKLSKTIDGKKITKTFIIETKGFERARDKIINRLADVHYNKRDCAFFVITNAGKKSIGNRNYYLYKTAGIAKRGAKTRTFWETIGIPNITTDIYEKALKLVREEQNNETTGELTICKQKTSK